MIMNTSFCRGLVGDNTYKRLNLEGYNDFELAGLEEMGVLYSLMAATFAGATFLE